MKKAIKRVGGIISAVLAVCLGAAIATSMYIATTKVPLKQYFPPERTNAIWDWSNVLARSDMDLKELVDFMYLRQLNTVFVDVSVYANALNEEGKVKNASLVAELEAALQRYVSAMSRRDIAVFAAAGDVYWSDRDKQHIPLAILKFAQDFNDKHPDTKLAGVEFDIESYNQKDFPSGSETVKSLVLVDYVSLVNRLVAANREYVLKGGQLELGLALPYWFDNQNGNIPSIVWAGKSGPTLYHVMDSLNSLPKSNVVIMAYRNAARGNDGVIAHSRTEVDYAAAKAQRVKVLIGQEVNDVEPAKITYYGQTAEELSGQFGYVIDEFGSQQQFGGIAINDLAGYKELLGVSQ